MIDIETLSTEPNAFILSISAIKFDIVTGKEIAHFDAIIADNQNKRSISKSTMDFWMHPANNSVYNNTQSREKWQLNFALCALNKLIGEDDFVWANSPSFDLVILKNAYAQYGIKSNIDFRNEMCLRTLNNLFPKVRKNMENIGTDHNSLDDCRFQINCLIEIMGMLDLLKD
jgi:hypothetical protein